MVTFIDKVNKVIMEEYVSRLAIQKRDRSSNKPRGLKLTQLNPDKRYLFQNFQDLLRGEGKIFRITKIVSSYARVISNMAKQRNET
jgi:hypothetical protein